MGAGGRWGGMPDLNYDEPAVRETHAYLKELAAAVRKAKPQAVMVGENAADREDQIAPYFAGEGGQVFGGGHDHDFGQ